VCQNLAEANQLNTLTVIAMPKFDDMTWHLGGGEFPPDLPEENAATHIGFFVAWAINNGLWDESEDAGESLAIQRVRDRTQTGRTFLIEQCDGKLLSGMLNKEGSAFAKKYYPRSYDKDYQRYAKEKEMPWWRFW